MQKTWCVGKENAGTKLQTHLRAQLGLSLKPLRRALEQNSCQVNGNIERFGSTLLKEGDCISFSMLTDAPREIEILFEDDTLLAVNKPPHLSCDKQGIVTHFPHYKLVHRLDKDTTGVLLFAKTAEAARELGVQFRKGLIRKEYFARVDGIPKKNAGYCESFLAKTHWYQGQTTYGSQKSGSLAKTKWRVEKKGKDSALLRVHPLTGKTHQIRVHLMELGHPILGDRQYAKRFVCAYCPKRVLLHAHTLTFFHPLTGKKCTVQAPLPKELEV